MKNQILTITLILTLNLLMSGFNLAQAGGFSSLSIEETPASPTVPRANVSNINPRALDLLIQQEQVIADAAAARESAMLQDMLDNLTGRTSVSDIGTVLVVPSEPISTEQLVEINEDLNIMSNIFNNELNRSRIDTSEIEWMYSSGTWVPNNLSSYLGRRDNESSIMYLAGYGVLFSTKVDIPLAAPAGQESQVIIPVEENESVWERTRGQLYGQSFSQSGTSTISTPAGGGIGGVYFDEYTPPWSSSTVATGRRNTTSTRSSEDRYDPEKVENLKVAMLQALKQASNIRALKDDESVIISITGSKMSQSSDAMIRLEADAIVNIQKRSDGITQINYIENGATRTRRFDNLDPNDIVITQTAPEVLVIRAQKSDIDAFANGQSDMEQFRQNAQIISYPLLSESSVILTSSGRSLTAPVRSDYQTTEEYQAALRQYQQELIRMRGEAGIDSSSQPTYTPPWESAPGDPLSSTRLSMPSTVNRNNSTRRGGSSSTSTSTSSSRNLTSPNRSDYETTEEYQQAVRQYQQELIRMREGQTTTSTNPDTVQSSQTQQSAESEEE